MQSGIGRVQARWWSLHPVWKRPHQYSLPCCRGTHPPAKAATATARRKPLPYLISWRGAWSPGYNNGAFAGQVSQHGDECEGEGRSHGDLAGRDTISHPHVTHSNPETDGCKDTDARVAPSTPQNPDTRSTISVLLMARHHTDPVILSPTEAQQGVVGINIFIFALASGLTWRGLESMSELDQTLIISSK